ncbi:hypothetical protein D3C75_706590 [compost metagenome]
MGYIGHKLAATFIHPFQLLAHNPEITRKLPDLIPPGNRKLHLIMPLGDPPCSRGQPGNGFDHITGADQKEKDTHRHSKYAHQAEKNAELPKLQDHVRTKKKGIAALLEPDGHSHRVAQRILKKTGDKRLIGVIRNPVVGIALKNRFLDPAVQLPFPELTSVITVISTVVRQINLVPERGGIVQIAVHIRAFPLRKRLDLFRYPNQLLIIVRLQLRMIIDIGPEKAQYAAHEDHPKRNQANP